MMAARAGAASVVGAEVNRHMCDVADECLAKNGLLGPVTILNGDARRLRSQPGPDGTPADVERRADLLVYEVSLGLITNRRRGFVCGKVGCHSFDLITELVLEPFQQY